MTTIPPCTGNKVPVERIDWLIENAETQEHVFHDKVLVIEFKLYNGFTVCGRGACVDPANFDIDKGREVAIQDAKNQLWQIEGYKLQCHLHEIGGHWLNRMVFEMRDLDEKIVKLGEFLQNEDAPISVEQRGIMVRQLKAMDEYSTALHDRLEEMGVEPDV